MAHDAAVLLTGAAALPQERAAIERVLEASPQIEKVIELLTMVLGPNALLVAARVDLADTPTAEEIERAMTDVARDVREAVPDVTEVFLDPTPGPRRP